MKKTAKKDKNTNTSKVMSSVASVIDFIKISVISNLKDANDQGKVNITDEELRKVCFYVEAGIETAFSKSSGQIENSLK